MGKVTYTFDTFEDSEELLTHQNAMELETACREYTEWMRSQIKTGEDEKTIEIIEMCQEKFWQIIGEYLAF